jgi:hypothetical protein
MIALLFALCLGAQSPETATDTAARAFFKAFTDADAQSMKAFLAEKVRMDGDLRFLPPNAPDGTITRDQLADGYTKLFGAIGREKWADIFRKVQPTLIRASKDGEVLAFVKAGDLIYDLHLREAIRGARSGLDDAVVFVWRVVDGKPRIVGHYADY